MNAKGIRPDGSDGTDNKNSTEHGLSLKNLREPLKERVTTHCEKPLFFFSYVWFQRKRKKGICNNEKKRQ